MSTLQELLNLGLLDIGSDDSRLTKMEATGAVLVKHLLSNPALVIPATLIAIDRDADENDPILTLVDEQLVNQWKTIRNTHVNSPRELLRSIIIQALSALGPDKPTGRSGCSRRTAVTLDSYWCETVLVNGIPWLFIIPIAVKSTSPFD